MPGGEHRVSRTGIDMREKKSDMPLSSIKLMTYPLLAAIRGGDDLFLRLVHVAYIIPTAALHQKWR